MKDVPSQALASQVAGAISTLCFYPLDVVKVRFMAEDGTRQRLHNGIRYTSISGALRAILSDEGPRALYRGAHVAVATASCSWGVYMFLYRSFLHGASIVFGDHTEIPFAARWAASATASGSVTCLANPLWLVKARMQLEVSHAGDTRVNRSLWQGLRHGIEQDGVRLLWRGSSAQLLVSIPGAISFPLYDTFKMTLRGHDQNRPLSMVELGACSVTAKTIVSSLCHPLILVRVRLQDEAGRTSAVRYTAVMQALKMIVRREGCRGLFRGFVPGLVQIVPRGVTHFALYELFQQRMGVHS